METEEIDFDIHNREQTFSRILKNFEESTVPDADKKLILGYIELEKQIVAYLMLAEH